MNSAKIRGFGVVVWLVASLVTASSNARADEASHGPLMVRVQLEPGALLARQNGPLMFALNSFGLAGSLSVGAKVSSSTAVGAEIWVGMALGASLDITPPAFEGRGDSVSVKGPSLLAILAGPSITHVFEPEMFSVSATFGVSLGRFDYDTYDKNALPYNRDLTIDAEGDNIMTVSPIPLDKTNVGWGFGVALAKVFPLSDEFDLGVGLQFRYLAIPDDAVYFDDDPRGANRFRADTWSVTSFGANVSLTYF